MSDFLHYFEAELVGMSEAMATFAALHPEKARTLGLSSGRCEDPNLQRLGDAVAFVAARLSKQLDDFRGDIALDLLRSLAPSLLLGAPSYCCLAPAADTQWPATPDVLPRGSRLTWRQDSSDYPSFTTARDSALVPLRLTGLRLETAPFAHPVPSELSQVEGALILELEASIPRASIAQLGIEQLDFYLTARSGNRQRLAEALTGDIRGIAIATDRSSAGQRLESRLENSLSLENPLGFLPAFSAQHQGIERLHDALAYPDKGFFFSLRGLRQRLQLHTHQSIQLRLYLGRRAMQRVRRVERNDIAINVVPCLNLFEVTSEPMRYPLARDRVPVRVPPGNGHNPHILRILSLTQLRADGEQQLPEWGTPAAADDRHVRWQERLRSANMDPGQREISLSMPPPGSPGSVDLVARLLCSNGASGMRPRPGTRGYFQASSLAESVFEVLDEPTAAQLPELNATRQWDLLALLGGNLSSLLETADPAQALRRSLHLCAPEGYLEDAGAILAVQASRATAPLRHGRSSFIATGVHLEIVLDIRHLTWPPTLFAMSLENFLVSFVSYDRFLQLRVRESGREHPYYSPPRRNGTQVSL